MVPLPLPPVAARGVGLTRQHELADILVELAHEERVNERHIYMGLAAWLAERAAACVCAGLVPWIGGWWFWVGACWLLFAHGVCVLGRPHEERPSQPGRWRRTH
jgi:hypothetical protein